MAKYKMLESYGKFKLWESIEKNTSKIFKVTYRGENRAMGYYYKVVKEAFEKIKHLE